MRKNQGIYQLTDLNLDNYNLLLNETLFHNANGYIGVRSVFEEGYPEGYLCIRGQYINGFYDFSQIKQAESLCGLVEEKQTMLNVADTQSVRLYLDDEEFSMFRGTVLFSRRWLDMDRGLTGREVKWRSPEGREVLVTVVRMAHFTQLPLFTIDYTVEPLNFEGEIVIESHHNGRVCNYGDPDPRTAGECTEHLRPVNCEIAKGTSYITSEAFHSGLRVCSGVKNMMRTEHERHFTIDDNNAICTLVTEARPGAKVRLLKYCVFCDGIRYSDCKEQAVNELKKALKPTPEELYRRQEAYLSDFWENCRVRIEGDGVLDRSLQYNMYQLIQSVGKDRFCSVAPKGLSGDGYEGHYFWDAEMYVQPFFNITNPEITKTLIEYRFATLDMARENAKNLGHEKGALYPWRTITGGECSGYFPAGSAQYHINGDIAYAVIAYYLATGDLPFIEEMGAEIIFETARLWIDAGNFHNGRFHINGVTGPDEYTCIVNNNYYTNVLAQYHLNWAAKLYSLMRESGIRRLEEKIGISKEEAGDFERAAAAMYLPYDEELGINPQDDSFLRKKKWDIQAIPENRFPLFLHYHPLYLYRHQVCKQPDTVMAHFILEDAQSENTMRNSFNYYEPITTYDSSLSLSIFSAMAARLGMVNKALLYLMDSARLDLSDLNQDTYCGIHTANMGGSYMAVVYGMGGFRLKESGISFAPVLPKEWTAYSFIVSYRGSRIVVEAKEGRCAFMLEKGDAVRLTVYGKEFLLEDRLDIEPPKASRGKQPHYDAVIFDLDGVICETDRFHFLAWKKLAGEIGVSIDDRINDRLRGIGRMESLEVILENYGHTFSEDEKRRFAERKNTYYRRFLADMSPSDLDPKVKATLDRLRAGGVRLAVGSSSRNARYILERIGLGGYFDCVADGNDIARSKPDPEVFRKAAACLEVPPESCLVVEDAATGIEAAFAADMDCAAIGKASMYRGATYTIESLTDLLPIVGV
ncbi:MAG: beta-phosphoglucomutase [Christensenellales bacterium]|jgi:alpha,alpha-trehalose phosphorylase